MIRVTTLHGETFQGRDSAAVIRQMRDAAWMWGDPKRDYMDAVADRIEQQVGVRPDTTVLGFLRDLLALGYLQREVIN